MAGFARTKRVTDPFGDKIKALIVGKEPVYASSGSEHGGENDDVESPCLSDLVHKFLEDEDTEGDSPCEPDSGGAPLMHDPTDEIADIVNQTAVISGDSFTNVLLANVSKAMVAFSCLKSNKSVFRRNVMAFLRQIGFNAAICKTKWESSGGLTAGSYEFIDVVRSDSATSQLHRYFVDLDFADEFEIARPTDHYERILRTLPRVFVGKSEGLKQMVKVMSDSAKRSLRSRGLSLPPWRKNRFMQNKWFGPYRRTLSLTPSKSLSFPSPANPGSAVKCCSVGFDAVNGPLLTAAATRTR